MSTVIRENIPILTRIDSISYHWLMFTSLVGVWEYTYVCNRKKVRRITLNLLSKKQHVWTKKYSLDYLLPSKLAKQFYAEYAAYADREYGILKDWWSSLIEGSHAVFCGFFAMMSVVQLAVWKHTLNTPSELNAPIVLHSVFVSIAMASQFMNSLLYMGQYFIQIKDVDSINNDTTKFPCGMFLLKRPFMYVNVFWLIMPVYVMCNMI